MIPSEEKIYKTPILCLTYSGGLCYCHRIVEIMTEYYKNKKNTKICLLNIAGKENLNKCSMCLIENAYTDFKDFVERYENERNKLAASLKDGMYTYREINVYQEFTCIGSHQATALDERGVLRKKNTYDFYKHNPCGKIIKKKEIFFLHKSQSTGWANICENCGVVDHQYDRNNVLYVLMPKLVKDAELNSATKKLIIN